jgi:hypothetical protein
MSHDSSYPIRVHARALAQRFEHGMIIHTRIPRTHAPNQWFLLVEGERCEYWTFITPLSFLGPDALLYRTADYIPPAGLRRPDAVFGPVWTAARDLLGWALDFAQVYEFSYEAPQSGDPYAPPACLLGPDGMWLSLHPDRTWEIKQPVGEFYPA